MQLWHVRHGVGSRLQLLDGRSVEFVLLLQLGQLRSEPVHLRGGGWLARDFAKRHNDNTPNRRSTTTAPKRHNDITTPKRHHDNAEPVKAAAQKTLRCDSGTPDFLAAFRACTRGRAREGVRATAPVEATAGADLLAAFPRERLDRLSRTLDDAPELGLHSNA